MNRSPRRAGAGRKARRALLLALLTLTAVLIAAPAALASAGSGTFNFSGGGGGGGGGHISGFALFLIFRLLLDVIIWGHGAGLVLVLLLLGAAYFYFAVLPRMAANLKARRQQGTSANRKTRQRERRVELAAAEAADEDPMFDPETIRRKAAELFLEIQQAWDAGDRRALETLIAPRLYDEWERRLDEMHRQGIRNRVQPLGPPTVKFVGIRNRVPARAEVVVRIDARLRDYAEDRFGRKLKRNGQFTETVRLREFWTLQRRGNRWLLESIEQGSEGSHQLQEKIVATSWSDEQALREDALVEAANADALAPERSIGDYASVDLSSDARAAANDLSLVDGRFAPDILEISARRAIQAWSQAVDGDIEPLRKLAWSQAVDQLLYPDGPRSRMVVRGITASRIHIDALDPHAAPPTMTLTVEVTGRRYLQDRATAAILAGSDTRTSTHAEHWTLALTQDPDHPWQIVSVALPSAARR